MLSWISKSRTTRFRDERISSFAARFLTRSSSSLSHARFISSFGPFPEHAATAIAIAPAGPLKRTGAPDQRGHATTRFVVSSAYAKHIIGRHGGMKKSLEHEYECKISISNEEHAGGNREIHLNGASASSMEALKQRILTLVALKQQGRLPPATERHIKTVDISREPAEAYEVQNVHRGPAFDGDNNVGGGTGTTTTRRNDDRSSGTTQGGKPIFIFNKQNYRRVRGQAPYFEKVKEVFRHLSNLPLFSHVISYEERGRERNSVLGRTRPPSEHSSSPSSTATSSFSSPSSSKFRALDDKVTSLIEETVHRRGTSAEVELSKGLPQGTLSGYLTKRKKLWSVHTANLYQFFRVGNENGSESYFLKIDETDRSPDDWVLMIDQYAKRGNTLKMFQFFEGYKKWLKIPDVHKKISRLYAYVSPRSSTSILAGTIQTYLDQERFQKYAVAEKAALLKQLRKPSVFVYNVVLKSLCITESTNIAVIVALYSEMKSAQVYPNADTMKILLKRIIRESNSKELMNDVVDEILSMPDPVDDEMWMLLFTYASKHFTDVENVFRLFDQRRQAWGAQHGSAEHSQQTKGTYGIGNAYLLLIGALGRSKRFGLMTKTFHDMLRHGVLPTEVTFVVIMNAFVNSGRSRDLKKALSLFDMMQTQYSNVISISRVSYNVLLRAYSKMEDEVKLVETFHKMRQSSSFFPTIVDYNTMLNFYASRCLESTDVTAFSREAVENGGPNDIEEDNESGDSRTISMKERERCLTKIRFYFDDAATNNVFYNMHSCHIILRGLGSLGDFNQMYAYLMEMETAGFVIDIRTVNTMLGALAVSNSYSNTEELRKCFEFGRRNFSLNGTSYRVMLHHFANKLDVDSCKSIVALAAKDDIPLDVGAKMELLKLYVRLAGRRYLQEERTFPDNLASEIKAVVASIPLHASTVSRRKLYRLVDILASRMTFSDAVYILQQIYTLPTTLAPSSQNDNAGNNKPTQDHLAASTPAVWSMLSVVTQAKRSVAILTEKEYNDIFSFKLSTESESVGVEVSSAAGQRDENASEDDLAIPLSLGWLMQLSASLSSLETEITGGLRTHTRTHTVLPSSTDGAADSSNVRTAENESNWSSKQVITTGSLLKLFALREKMYLVNMRIEKLAQ